MSRLSLEKPALRVYRASYFQTLKQYVSTLRDYSVILVRVDYSMNYAEEKQERGDRAIGQGEDQTNGIEPQDL